MITDIIMIVICAEIKNQSHRIKVYFFDKDFDSFLFFRFFSTVQIFTAQSAEKSKQ